MTLCTERSVLVSSGGQELIPEAKVAVSEVQTV